MTISGDWSPIIADTTWHADDVRRRNSLLDLKKALPEITVKRGGLRYPPLKESGGWCMPADSLWQNISSLEPVCASLADCGTVLHEAENTPSKGAGMSDYSYMAVEQVRSEIEAERVAAEAKKLRADIEAYGEDTYEVGTTFTFTATNSCGGDPKPFAVVKGKNDKWSVTGDRSQWTWDELVMWLLTDGVTIRRADVTFLSA